MVYQIFFIIFFVVAKFDFVISFIYFYCEFVTEFVWLVENERGIGGVSSLKECFGYK